MKSYKFNINSKPYTVEINSVEGGKALVNVNGVAYEEEIESTPDGAPAATAVTPAAAPTAVPSAPATPTAAPAASAVASAPAAPAAPAAPVASGTGSKVCAPLPGVILSINVAVGDSVKAGDKVAVLEAMKMENDIEAEVSGTVTAIHVQKGDSVLEGTAIVSIG
jgi:biotin carboxyl carrier protein